MQSLHIYLSKLDTMLYLSGVWLACGFKDKHQEDLGLIENSLHMLKIR